MKLVGKISRKTKSGTQVTVQAMIRARTEEVRGVRRSAAEMEQIGELRSNGRACTASTRSAGGSFRYGDDRRCPNKR